MVFSVTNSKGVKYYLHGKKIPLRNGRQQQIYYFSKYIRDDEALVQVPADRIVFETKNGLPVLKKKAEQGVA